MIVTTEAVVLRTMKYRDTSRIATLYTSRYGKISVIAKGARDKKNTFGSSLQPMSHVQAILYKKENRDLHLLSQCTSITPLRHLADDMHRMAAAMSAIELVNAVTHGEDENPALFTLLTRTLVAIDGATKGAPAALYFFEARLLEVLGFAVNFQQCAKCLKLLDEAGTGTNGVGLQLQRGGVVCFACIPDSIIERTVSLVALRVLQRLQDLNEPVAATRMVFSRQVAEEIGLILRRFLQYHIEGLRDLKSEAVFSAVL
ncbi:MAG: DNA repair protein RecO [Bacteroidota bacterium]